MWGSTLQWVVDAYMLVFAGLLLAIGNLGDRHGRKRVLQLGLGVFGAASVAGAFAETGAQLIAARAAMGVGAAAIMPATLSIIMDVFPQEERGKAVGIWAGMAAIGIGLGPLIGGALIELSSWPAVFWINLPITLIAIALGTRWVPESRDPAPGALDAPGVVLSIGSLGSLVWGIIEASERGWTDGLVLSAFGAGVVLGILFVLRQRSARDPLLDVSLFRRPAFSVGSAAISAVFFALFGMFFLMTQYLQVAQGKSALATGLQMLPVALGLVAGSALSHTVNVRVGAPRQISTAMVAVAAMLASVALWTPATAWWVIALFFLALPFAMGNVMAPASEAIMSAVPLAKAGVGSARTTSTAWSPGPGRGRRRLDRELALRLEAVGRRHRGAARACSGRRRRVRRRGGRRVRPTPPSRRRLTHERGGHGVHRRYRDRDARWRGGCLHGCDPRAAPPAGHPAEGAGRRR